MAGCLASQLIFSLDRRDLRTRSGPAINKDDLTEALKAGGRSSAAAAAASAAQSAGDSETALALVLLIGAALMIQSSCASNS